MLTAVKTMTMAAERFEGAARQARVQRKQWVRAFEKLVKEAGAGCCRCREGESILRNTRAASAIGCTIGAAIRYG